jgi:hypothetical protein
MACSLMKEGRGIVVDGETTTAPREPRVFPGCLFKPYAHGANGGDSIMALTIFCDESGYSGGNLLLDEHRFYTYASIAIANDEAIEHVKKIRADTRTQAPELKFESLGKNERGRASVKWLLETLGTNFGVFYADKRFSTAAKFFEYTFEPVLRDKKEVYLHIDFHRFISMFMFQKWTENDTAAMELLEDGQNLIRGKVEPKDLKRLMKQPLHLARGDDPLTAIMAFCYAYRTGILREIRTAGADPELKKWTMDISDPALTETFHHWGDGGEELEFYCDESKPLKASAEHTRELATKGFPEEFKRMYPGHFADRPLVKMPNPVQFVDSKGSLVAIQLADVIAGATRIVLTKPETDEAKELAPLIEPRYLKNCVRPRWEFLDNDRATTGRNYLFLKELGKRARRRQDPNYAIELSLANIEDAVEEAMRDER